MSLVDESIVLIHIPSESGTSSTLSSPGPSSPHMTQQPTQQSQPTQQLQPTIQRQPPPHMPPALSQDVTNISFKLLGFYGDESNEKEALNHITQFQFACHMRDSQVHDIIIDLFLFTLLGQAKDWWDDQAVWQGKDKGDYKVIVGEWMKRWPEKKKRMKLQHERVPEFKELELADNDVERKVVVDGDEVYVHVEFVQQLRKKARACGDQNLMVVQGITKLPQWLQEALSPVHVDFKTWEELVDAVVALSPARIELADKALAIKEKIHSLFLSSPGPAAPQQMYANSQPQVSYQLPSPYYAAARLQPMRTSWSPLRTPMSQGALPVDLYGEIMPKTSKEVKLEHKDTKEG